MTVGSCRKRWYAMLEQHDWLHWWRGRNFSASSTWPWTFHFTNWGKTRQTSCYVRFGRWAELRSHPKVANSQTQAHHSPSYLRPSGHLNLSVQQTLAPRQSHAKFFFSQSDVTECTQHVVERRNIHRRNDTGVFCKQKAKASLKRLVHVQLWLMNK